MLAGSQGRVATMPRVLRLTGRLSDFSQDSGESQVRDPQGPGVLHLVCLLGSSSWSRVTRGLGSLFVLGSAGVMTRRAGQPRSGAGWSVCVSGGFGSRVTLGPGSHMVVLDGPAGRWFGISAGSNLAGFT